MGFPSVRMSGSLFLMSLLGSFVYVYFVQFLYVSFCFILFYFIIIPWKPDCFLMRDRNGVDVDERRSESMSY